MQHVDLPHARGKLIAVSYVADHFDFTREKRTFEKITISKAFLFDWNDRAIEQYYIPEYTLISFVKFVGATTLQLAVLKTSRS